MKQIVRSPRVDERREQDGGLGERRSALALGLVEQRRVPERDAAGCAGRAVGVDDAHLEARQRRAGSAGFAIVADASRNCGALP